MAIILLKGLLGILGLFYNNSKGARKEEESKQPIKLGDTILALTPIILGTNNL